MKEITCAVKLFVRIIVTASKRAGGKSTLISLQKVLRYLTYRQLFDCRIHCLALRSLFFGVPVGMSKVSAIIVGLLLCASVSAPLMAQTVGAQDLTPPEKSSSPGIVSSFTLDFLNDQKAIWTSPLHVTGNDLKWIAPLDAAGGALFAFDHRISDAVKGDTSLKSPSNAISNVGLIAPWAVPGAMWFLGS